MMICATSDGFLLFFSTGKLDLGAQLKKCECVKAVVVCATQRQVLIYSICFTIFHWQISVHNNVSVKFFYRIEMMNSDRSNRQ